jgi:DNA topoisomerase-2
MEANSQPTKAVRVERNAADYKHMSAEKHILAKPAMYIGPVTPALRPSWLLDHVTKKLFYANISVPPGLIHLFIEALSNAADNADSSRRMGTNPGNIAITMDRQTITIRNGGEPIPVVQHPGDPTDEDTNKLYGLWIPGVIFGMLRSSSNYDEKVLRLGAGVHGIGIKLCNIFSTRFTVQVGDPKNRRLYQGIWENNMSVKSYENITEDYIGDAFVEISWNADFARFSTDDYNISDGYPDEMVGIIAAAAAGVSLTAKIPVSFNGELLDYRNIRNYLSLFWSKEVCETAIIHYEWPREVLTSAEKKAKKVPRILAPDGFMKASAKEKERLIANPSTPEYIPMCEVAIMDTPDAAVTLSYVNAQMTIDGGVHVNSAMSAFSKEILEGMNAELKKAATRGRKKDDDDDKKKATPKLVVDDIKPHMSMVLNCRLADPQYTSQTKTVLASPNPDFHIDDKIVDQIGRWNMIDRLMAVLESKIDSKLKGTDGKQRRSKHMILGRGEDGANEAGGPRSSECVLYLPEGNSAAAYIKKRISNTPGKKDLSGYLPLRGKLPNASSMHKLRIAANKVINSLKQMWGLQSDKDYHKPEDRSTLNYGFLCMAADADSDAQHIIALVVEYLNKFFPALLKCGVVSYLRTPVVRIYKGKNILYRFTAMTEYKSWIESTTEDSRKGLEIKYYKGLAKHKDTDIADDLTTAPVVIVIYDSQASATLDLAFDKERADDRKAWIKKWRDVVEVDDVCTITVAEATNSIFRYQDISQFGRRELVTYMRDSLIRAIPCMFDGFKKSQRQAVYSALVHWKYGRGREKALNISRFGNKAAEMTHYHHGEKSICDTITRLGQEFVGSNNLAYFEADGQIGNRDEGGADAGESRYVGVSLAWWIKYVYDEELIKMVPLRKEDEEDVEPEWLPAIVPMHVINGALGIATGYSTYMPPHNPFDVIRWLFEKCNDRKPKPLTPWFLGFTGFVDVFDPTISKIDRARSKMKKDSPQRTLDEIKILSKSDETVEDVIFPVDSIKDDVADDGSEGGDAAEPTLNDELAAANAKPGKKSLRTFGEFTVTSKTKDGKFNIEITELPIGCWMKPYKEWLKFLVSEGKLKDFHDGGDPNHPKYTLIGFQHQKGASYQTLRLQRSFGLSNMTLIDTNGNPEHFNNVEDMMELFYASMIQIFEAQRQNNLEDIQTDIHNHSEKLRYILEVLKYEETRDKPVEEREGLWIVGRKKAEVFLDLDRLEFAHDLLKKVHFADCTYEEIENIRGVIAKLTDKFIEIEKLRPQDMWATKLQAFDKILRDKKYGV